MNEYPKPCTYSIDVYQLQAIRNKLNSALQPVVEFHHDHDCMTREAIDNMRRDIAEALALLPDASKYEERSNETGRLEY